MIQTLEELAQGAIQLPPDQRYALAQRILESVEPPGDASADEAWAMVIRERIRKYDAGETKGIPAAEVFAEVQREFEA